MDVSLQQLKRELASKERNIFELSEYISNRNETDRTPNYSLLLGAGCSISSGIRPASTLISAWKEEIYLSSNDVDDNLNLLECVNDYFESDAVASWYDPRNEYCCLFEKKYDLPRQRRVFVEREVSGKNPSLGYAYLMRLVQSRYFSTLFTTNFDDLLNEAFYQFSNERPIVCAHDSAVSSITVTSERPKVIKLHGDYLFDDIKSISRETESLEDNIKNKFIEFAKDFGLIVVGYSGNDRSVMDVLNNLLRQEQYFKHGIYWCLRKDAMVNSELRKLFWKDKVYFVEIDGFDEMMAVLNKRLKCGELPVDTYANSNRAVEIVSGLTENEMIKNCNCEVIKSDLDKLKQRLKFDTIDVAMSMINEDTFLGEKNNNVSRKAKEKN